MSIWDCPACLADDDGCSCSLTMVPPTERDGITVGDKVTLVARHGARYPVEVIGFTGLDCDVEVRWLGLSPFTGSPTNTVCRRDLAAIEKPQPPASDSPASVSPEQTPSPPADSAHSGEQVTPDILGSSQGRTTESWETGDVVRDANGAIYERNVRYIDRTFVWRTFGGDWYREDYPLRPLVRMLPEADWHVCNPALMPDPLCPGCMEDDRG